MDMQSPGSSAPIRIDWRRFGRDVRAERERRNESMLRFASRLGVEDGDLFRVENGEGGCTAELFLTLCLAMNRSLGHYVR